MSGKEKAYCISMGILIGAVVGAAVGLLFAPKSGRETRAMIRDKALETKDKAAEILDEARERAKKIVGDAKGKAAEIERGQT